MTLFSCLTVCPDVFRLCHVVPSGPLPVSWNVLKRFSNRDTKLIHHKSFWLTPIHWSTRLVDQTLPISVLVASMYLSILIPWSDYCTISSLKRCDRRGCPVIYLHPCVCVCEAESQYFDLAPVKCAWMDACMMRQEQSLSLSENRLLTLTKSNSLR